MPQGKETFIDRFKDEKRAIDQQQKGCLVGKKKVNKGAWGMPGLLEAKKDVVSCDKPWGLANLN